jgi:NDP-sugar pyrophosphorylase family protein
MSFRGINTTVIQIRRQVFTEVARMAYANVKGEQANHLMRKIPYTIIPGEEGKLRKDIFLERAIVEDSVLLPGAIVKDGAHVVRAILGENAVVEEGVKLGSVDMTKDTAVVGNDVVIGKGE